MSRDPTWNPSTDVIGYSRDPGAVGDVVAVRRNRATGHLGVALAAISPPVPIPPDTALPVQRPRGAANPADAAGAAVAAAEAGAHSGATVTALLAARDAIPSRPARRGATSPTGGVADDDAADSSTYEPDRDGRVVLVTAVLGEPKNRSGLSVSWVGDCCACYLSGHGLELLTDHPLLRPGGPPAPIAALQHATVETLGHALLRSRPRRILLTSPGVHHRLGPDLMAHIARTAPTAQDAARQLTDAATRARRGATAVVLEPR